MIVDEVISFSSIAKALFSLVYESFTLPPEQNFSLCTEEPKIRRGSLLRNPYCFSLEKYTDFIFYVLPGRILPVYYYNPNLNNKLILRRASSGAYYLQSKANSGQFYDLKLSDSLLKQSLGYLLNYTVILERIFNKRILILDPVLLTGSQIKLGKDVKGHAFHRFGLKRYLSLLKAEQSNMSMKETQEMLVEFLGY